MLWGFGDGISCIPDWSRTGYVMEEDLECLMQILPNARIRDRCQHCLLSAMLRMEPRASYLLHQHSIKLALAPACGQC